MVEAYTNIVLDAARAHIPHKCVTISDKDAPWITNTVKNAINKNNRLVKKWKANGKKPSDTLAKNRSQNDLFKLISEAKTKYIENLGKKISDPNTGSKIFWSSYKRLINNKKNTNIPPILADGTFISNFKEKAKCFNKLLQATVNPSPRTAPYRPNRPSSLSTPSER